MDEPSTSTIHVVRRQAKLISISVLSGPDVGREPPVVGISLRVGTGEDADLRLHDPTVSRLHCELVIEGALIRVRDLASKNGTWISGVRANDVALPGAARLQLGATTLDVRLTQREVHTEIYEGGPQLGQLLGQSVPMQRLFARMIRLGATSEPVLIHGESGSGKELVARALHELGPRKGKPFVIVDGAALSQSLAELELFGHGRGAFTGSHGERAGAFERAHGGTLFLDEVGELPLDLQPRFLRAVEDSTVQRLGDRARRQVDVRLVAATHRALPAMVNQGTVREDLYHRLAVFELAVPPLRDRGDDVARIAHAFLDGMGITEPSVRHTLERELAARAGYAWPGNVRELRNFVRRLAVLGEVGEPGRVPATEPEAGPGPRMDLPFHEAKQQAIDRFEREYCGQLLDEAGGNISEAARRAGVNRGHLSEMLKRLGAKRSG